MMKIINKTMSKATTKLNDYKSLYRSWLKANAPVVGCGQRCKLLQFFLIEKYMEKEEITIKKEVLLWKKK